jgi:hypothetical protein
MKVRSYRKTDRRQLVDHCTISEDGQIERRAVEGNELGVHLGDSVDKGRDQLPLGSLPNMRGTEGINDPSVGILMSDQSPNADNRVVDVLWKLVAQRLSDFVVGLAVMTIGGSKAL